MKLNSWGKKVPKKVYNSKRESIDQPMILYLLCFSYVHKGKKGTFGNENNLFIELFEHTL